jgi:hypothetical protein
VQAPAGSKTVTVPQSTLLDATKSFALCYLDGTQYSRWRNSTTWASSECLGYNCNATVWADSGIRLRISKVASLEASGITHKTHGHIASHASLSATYSGGLANNKWISMVPSTLNAGTACSGAIFAAHVKSTLYYTGPLQAGAGNKIITLNSRALGTGTEFAVCYAEASGTLAAQWYDSGIRLTISKITSTEYNVAPGQTARASISSIAHARNAFPQVADAKLAYVGDLAANKWISLVRSTLNNNEPCVQGPIAAAAPDTTHSGAARATTGTNTKEATILQAAGNLLDTSYMYAVCYAETDGSISDATWQDSYIRYSITKIESVIVSYGTVARHSTHDAALNPQYPWKTFGHLGNVATVSVTYTGSLATNKWISLVDEAKNSYNPCASGAEAAHAAGSLYTGAIRAPASLKAAAVDTTGLSTTTTFSVCYAETDGSATDATWADSGLRFTISKITSLSYGGGHQSSIARTMTAVVNAQDRLPQVERHAVVTYAGVLANYKWLSLVDSTLNANNPCDDRTTSTCNLNCGDRTIPAALPDTTHSGTVRAATGTKVVTLLQRTPGTRMLTTKIYAVCYAETDGGNTDSTWKDSYIRVRMSKIETITSHLVTHRTTGQIARVSSYTEGNHDDPYSVTSKLRLAYDGTLAERMWFSLVDQTLNNNNPCANASFAAGAPTSATVSGPASYSHGTITVNGGSLYSGSSRATFLDGHNHQKVAEFDTFVLNTPSVFAVCYSEALGNAAATWFDAGIRLTISKITYMKYGPDTTSHPVRRWYSPNDVPAINRLPQVTNAALTYVGDLAVFKWISAVDASLNSYNPCVSGAHAAAAADATHSGSLKAASGTKTVTVPQATFFNENKIFALCYAETSGNTADTTWRDSYVRFKISKLEKLSSHSITHLTDGTIARVSDLKLTYAGTLANALYISLVDQTINSNNPCDQCSWCPELNYVTGSAAGHAADTQYSGPVQAASGTKDVTVNTMGMSTAKTFSVCYAESGGTQRDVSTTNTGQMVMFTTWADSGLRLTISKVTTVAYGPTSTSFPRRQWESRNIFPQMNRMPYKQNALITYIGDLANDKFLGLVDASLNSNNPCVTGTDPTADPGGADNAHSGKLTAAAGTKDITVPQGVLFSTSKLFAVCYAETDGLKTDKTWRDSYVRFRISKMETLSAHGVTHYTDGSIARVAATAATATTTAITGLALTYAGNAGNDWFKKYVSLVDQTTNTNIPCDKSSASSTTATSGHTGVREAGEADTTFVVDTTPLSTSITFAVCYAELHGLDSDATWADSGIRLKVSKVTYVEFGGSSTSFVARKWTSPNTLPAINRLPQAVNHAFTYYGDLSAAKYMSVVDVSLNSNNPCVDASTAAASADTLHSGAQQAGFFTLGSAAILPATTIATTSIASTAKSHTVYVSDLGGPNGKFYIDGVQQASISMTAGITYTFDLTNGTNSGSPFTISTTVDGTHNSGSEYATGVTYKLP